VRGRYVEVTERSRAGRVGKTALKEKKALQRADPAAWGSRRVLGASPRRGSYRGEEQGCHFLLQI